MSDETFDLVIRNTSEVVTCDGPIDGAAEATLQPVSKGAIGITRGVVSWVGPEAELPGNLVTAYTETLDARGSFVGPGLVDCHTHLIFGGDRSAEFEMRCQGKSYLEIAQAGGGIAGTVAATRKATERELAYGAMPRLTTLLSHGVTTAEVKSGYGLSLDAELKILKAIRLADQLQAVKLVPTLLCLHAIPPEYKEKRAEYLALCADQVLPAVAEQKLAAFCDAFVEQSAFTRDEAVPVLQKAKALGFQLRLHVDQLTAGGGAQLAAELGSVTADHLEHVTAEGIAALKAASVVAVLNPTSTLFLREAKYAPGRALRDAGVQVALCTNSNPGSSMTENASLAMALGCLQNGLTPAEAYLGFTRSAAAALREPLLGRIAVGCPADLVVYQCKTYRQLPYHLGVSEVRHVLKDGLVCFELGRVVTKLGGIVAKHGQIVGQA